MFRKIVDSFQITVCFLFLSLVDCTSVPFSYESNNVVQPVIISRYEYYKLVIDVLVKLKSLVEYLMKGIENTNPIYIYVVGGCGNYPKFAETIKEALGENAHIRYTTKQVEHSSHGCWQVVNDVMEGKLKIEGKDCYWGFDYVKQCDEKKKIEEVVFEGDKDNESKIREPGSTLNKPPKADNTKKDSNPSTGTEEGSRKDKEGNEKGSQKDKELDNKGSQKDKEGNEKGSQKGSQKEKEGNEKGSQKDKEGNEKGSQKNKEGNEKGSQKEKEGNEKGSQKEKEGNEKGSQKDKEGNEKGSQKNKKGNEKGSQKEKEGNEKGSQENKDTTKEIKQTIRPSSIFKYIKISDEKTDNKESKQEPGVSVDPKQCGVVTLTVCDYDRLPLPDRVKSVDFAKSIREFMEKMLLQEREIFKINRISTLWNELSGRINEEIIKWEQWKSMDNYITNLSKLDKKKYVVLMDSVDNMNKDFTILAQSLGIDPSKEINPVKQIQKEWLEEKAALIEQLKTLYPSEGNSSKRNSEEEMNGNDGLSKRLKTDKYSNYLNALLELQEQLLKLQEQFGQENCAHQEQLVKEMQELLFSYDNQCKYGVEYRLNLIFDSNSICFKIRNMTYEIQSCYYSFNYYNYTQVRDLTNLLDQQLQQLSNNKNSHYSISMQLQLLNCLQQLENHYNIKDGKIDYALIQNKLQKYNNEGVSVIDILHNLRDKIYSFSQRDYVISSFLIDLYYLQMLLSLRLYEFDWNFEGPLLIMKLQKLLSQNQSSGSTHSSQLQQLILGVQQLTLHLQKIQQLGSVDTAVASQIQQLHMLFSQFKKENSSLYSSIQETVEKLKRFFRELNQNDDKNSTTANTLTDNSSPAQQQNTASSLNDNQSSIANNVHSDTHSSSAEERQEPSASVNTGLNSQDSSNTIGGGGHSSSKEQQKSHASVNTGLNS